MNSSAAIAAVCALVGFAAVVAGCVLIDLALALIVGGALLLALGFLIDDAPRRRRELPGGIDPDATPLGRRLQ